MHDDDHDPRDYRVDPADMPPIWEEAKGSMAGGAIAILLVIVCLTALCIAPAVVIAAWRALL